MGVGLDKGMASPETRILHPHVTADSRICGGSPTIAGTRFPVRAVVFYVLHLGLTADELAEKFPHLSLAQIYDAIAYYYDNREEVDEDIAANREELARREFPS